MPTPVNVHAIADYFIRRGDLEAGDVMTHLKLQKLLYYAQGWHLALKDTPLFSDSLEAWEHGPVCPSVWKRFKNFGWNPIPPTECQSDPERDLDADTLPFLDEVWDAYGQFSAKRLEEMTHEEPPWKDAWNSDPSGNAMIPLEALRAFFLTQIQTQPA
jgi:uncharacterized phage-associated protein